MSRPAAVLHSLEAQPGSLAATLSLGDVDHRITYEVDGTELNPRYEPFVAAALPIAMRRASSLAVEGRISPRLHGELPTIRRILSDWNDSWRPIEIHVEPDNTPVRSGSSGTAAFFSAGVDSFYTVLRQREEVDALVWVHGFDVPFDNPAMRDRVFAGVSKAAGALGLPLIEVRTDLRAASRGNCLWGMYHGAALASVVHALGPRFDRFLIPATNAYRDLYPWGSHPLLDPLWSTEAVEIVHDGVVARTEKVTTLARSDVVMQNLRVCFQKTGDYNCGRCEKCLRTMTTLTVLGALDRSHTFPHELPLRAIARLPLASHTEVIRTRENLAFAERLGADPAVTRALRRLLAPGAATSRPARPLPAMAPGGSGPTQKASQAAATAGGPRPRRPVVSPGVAGEAHERAPSRNPLACGALGRYDASVVRSVASRLEAPMVVAHADSTSMLMLDRDPIRWRSLRARGLGWAEQDPGRTSAVRSWKQASTSLSACGLVISGRRRFVHSSVTGVAPVYYLSRGEATYFASRLDALVLAVGGPLSVDWRTWACLFAIGWPIGDRTQFAEARRLGPFSVLERDGQRASAAAGPWPWAEVDPDLTVAEGAPALLEAIRERVATARGPTVCMLSGGLDSRLLLAVCAERGDGRARAITFVTPSRDAEIAAEVTAALDVPHELVSMDDPEEYWAHQAARALLGDFQYPAHVLWTPLRSRFRELGFTALDGLAFDAFAVHGGLFYTPEMFEAERTDVTKLLWRSFRRNALAAGPATVFAPEYRKAIDRVSRRLLVAESKPYRGHPNEAILAFYRARTIRAVATTPQQVLGSATRVLTPFASDPVARAALRIAPRDKLGHRLYEAVFERLDTPVSRIRSTSDPGPGRKRDPNELRFAPAMTANLERLLRGSPLAPHFSPELHETLASGALNAQFLWDRGTYNSVLALAWFGLWLERYQSELRELDPSEVLQLAA